MLNRAGKTNLPVGTRIKIIKSDEKDIIGITGKITHPFGGLMAPHVKYVAGVYLDPEYEHLAVGGIINLTSDDKFEKIDD